MIKTALEFIVGLKKPDITEHNGHEYTDKPLTLVTLPKAEPLLVCTLSAVNGFIDTLNRKGQEPGREIMIHIVSPAQIHVVSRELLSDMHREKLLVSSIIEHKFSFGDPMSQEAFIVGVQTHFVQTEATARLLKFVGNIKGSSVGILADDGVTQTVETKNGLSLGKNAEVSNPWTLAPFRTFTEIEQPESKYFLRLTKRGDGIPSIALHEVVDNQWQLVAIGNIRKWLLEHEPANLNPIIG